MSLDIRSLFIGYLAQLEVIVAKVPVDIFSLSLSDDMFSLEMNAKVAANFLLRGYCPLIGIELVSFYSEISGKGAVLEQITKTKAYLEQTVVIENLDDSKTLIDKAGFTEVALSPSEFIHKYIIPNFSFHMSMVYAIARVHGVVLSKGDYDGLHSYPTDFSFVRT